MIFKDIEGTSHQVDGCLACAIADGSLTPVGGILYKNEYFHVEQDFETPIEGFIIVSCLKHYTQFTQLPTQARHSLIDLVAKIESLLIKHKVAEQFTILMEERPNYHLHMWILPRHDWIVEKFKKINKNIKAIEDYAVNNLKTPENLEKIAKTYNMLKAELNK